jgi:hypothetical protein
MKHTTHVSVGTSVVWVSVCYAAWLVVIAAWHGHFDAWMLGLVAPAFVLAAISPVIFALTAWRRRRDFFKSFASGFAFFASLAFFSLWIIVPIVFRRFFE